MFMFDSVGMHKHGYPSLAAFQSSDERNSIYRRYSYLQARLLLEKQDQLRILEERLDTFDRADIFKHTRIAIGDLTSHVAPRNLLLREIEDVFLSYGMS
jgi:hypothetical protein